MVDGLFPVNSQTQAVNQPTAFYPVGVQYIHRRMDVWV